MMEPSLRNYQLFFDIIVHVLEKKLDVRKIFKKLNEIDIMKQILLTPQQRKLFQFFEKNDLKIEIIN